LELKDQYDQNRDHRIEESESLAQPACIKFGEHISGRIGIKRSIGSQSRPLGLRKGKVSEPHLVWQAHTYIIGSIVIKKIDGIRSAASLGERAWYIWYSCQL